MMNPMEFPNDRIPSQKKWMFLLFNTGKGNRQIENKGDLFKYSCLTKISDKVTSSHRIRRSEYSLLVFLQLCLLLVGL